MQHSGLFSKILAIHSDVSPPTLSATYYIVQLQIILTNFSSISHYSVIHHKASQNEPTSVQGNATLSVTKFSVGIYHLKIFFIWFVRLLALRALLAYCASLG
jgi:hypothetical protein